MKEYAVSLIAVAALISLSLAAFYKDGKWGATVRCAFAVLLLYATVCPLLSGEAGGFDIRDLKFDAGEYDFSDVSAVDGTSEVAFCNGIRLFLVQEFSLNADDVAVSAEGFDKAEMRAEKVTVRLSGGAVYCDFRAIREKIEKNGMGSCEVKIEG